MVEIKRVVNNTYASSHLQSFQQLFLRGTVKFKFSCLNKEDKNTQTSNVIRWEKGGVSFVWSDINYVFFQGRVPGEAMCLGLWLSEKITFEAGQV